MRTKASSCSPTRLKLPGDVYRLNGKPAAFGKLLQRAITQSWPMPRVSIGAIAAVICCFALGPTIYAGQGEPSAPGRLVPGGWLRPATPPQSPTVPEAARSPQPSAPEPVLARGLPKSAPEDNPIPIRPARAHSIVPRPIIIHRAKPPAPARTGARPDGKVQF